MNQVQQNTQGSWFDQMAAHLARVEGAQPPASIPIAGQGGMAVGKYSRKTCRVVGELPILGDFFKGVGIGWMGEKIREAEQTLVDQYHQMAINHIRRGEPIPTPPAGTNVMTHDQLRTEAAKNPPPHYEVSQQHQQKAPVNVRAIPAT